MPVGEWLRFFGWSLRHAHWFDHSKHWWLEQQTGTVSCTCDEGRDYFCPRIRYR